MTDTCKLPECPICGFRDHWLGDHLVEEHGMSTEEAESKYPGIQLASEAVLHRFEENTKRLRRRACQGPESAKIQFGRCSFPVHKGVPAQDCLPMPPFYQTPKHGELRKSLGRAFRHVFFKRSVYIYGPPGTGKDAAIHAVCAATRTPSAIYQIRPDLDISAWFFVRGFNKDQTCWEEGELLKQLRDGYQTETGERIPYLILFSDFDRASRSQAESLRLIMDSIEGRITGPDGRVYNVFPGTQIVATANTMGSGDENGRMISANPIDASILDRFNHKVLLQPMSWEDELPILKSKFPLFAARCSALWDNLKAATQALRTDIQEGRLYGEFSHRSVCAWVQDAEDILRLTKKPPKDLLSQSCLSVIEGFPDSTSRLAAKRLIDPHLPTGSLDVGNTEGYETGF